MKFLITKKSGLMNSGAFPRSKTSSDTEGTLEGILNKRGCDCIFT